MIRFGMLHLFPSWLRRLDPRYLRMMREARQARDFAPDRAIDLYRALLSIHPAVAVIQFHLGHALKDAGRLEEAVEAYRSAATLKPRYWQAHMHMGRVQKAIGKREASIDSYINAYRLQPESKEIREEIVRAGARHLLPDVAYGRSATTTSHARISANLQSALDELRDGIVSGPYPPQAYAAFRAAYPTPRPPSLSDEFEGRVVIDARDALPHHLRATLRSLTDQTTVKWQAVVIVDEAITAHPVASLALGDPRIDFMMLEDFLETSPPSKTGQSLLVTNAGALFDKEALAWISFAKTLAQGAALVCDHERRIDDWRGIVAVDPVFTGVLDSWEIESTPAPPALVFIPEPDKASLCESFKRTGSGVRRELIRSQLKTGGVGVLARVLISLPTDLPDDRPRPEDNDEPGDALIRVIIPTRDQPQMLVIQVESLLRLAVQPEKIGIVIVDNGGVTEEGRYTLQRLSRKSSVQVLSIDEPFNWSRLNNLAADAVRDEADILIFANDDMEMRSEGWDNIVRLRLQNDIVGVVGARLLYPDDSIQHAGVVLGGADGRPAHEGVGAAMDAAGPLGRWQRIRTAAAVTGAFIAVRKAVFECSGFDPRFAVGYNDIDFCLKVRQLGLSVLYDPSLVLTHHESATRGLNRTQAQVAWDNAEMYDLNQRWGSALQFDPSVNPQWASAPGLPFEGFREPPLSAIIRHLRMTARHKPWDTAFDNSDAEF